MKNIFALCLFLYGYATFAQSGSAEFTADGTFTVPDGVTEIFVEVVGAGGTGGYNGTGGGGGGGYASGMYTVTPGQDLTIDIGVPGGGTFTGTTLVGGFIAASGGENGVSVPNPEIGGGGSGGVGSGGTIANYAGGNGGGGYYTYFGGGGAGAGGPLGNGGDGGNTIAWTGICNTPGGDGGIGGGAPGGNGGKGAGFTDDFCNVTDPSAPGANYGGGGGGGNGNGGSPSAGMGGYARIIWCSVNVNVTATDSVLSADMPDATYQWIDCADMTSVADATTQSFIPVISGNYAVIVNDGICADTSACFEFTVIVNHTADAITSEIFLSPNPVHDQFTIQYDGSDVPLVQIFTLTGELLLEVRSATVSMSTINTGMYLTRIEVNGHVAWRQILKY